MELVRQEASVLLAALAARRLGAAELMQATLERIDAVNGTLNAIVALRPPRSCWPRRGLWMPVPGAGPCMGCRSR